MNTIKVTIYLQNNTVTFNTKFEDYKKTYKDLFELFTSTNLQIIKTEDRNIIIAPSKIQAIEFERGKESDKCEIIEVKESTEEDIISD